MHFCNCGRHDHTAYVGWFCTTRLTSALRRQQGGADHTSITTRDQTRWEHRPVNTDAMTNGFLGADEKSHAADAIGAPLIMVCSEWCNYDSDQRLQPLPGSFSRASSCYIFITIMVQVASRRWPYAQHLRNRRRCVEEWRSSTPQEPDVPAVPLWNSPLCFIFKQKHPNKNNQVLSNLSDWHNGNWTTELLAKDVIWLWKYADVEYQPCMDLVVSDFLFPTFRLKGCTCPRVEFVITVFLALRCNSDNERRQFKTDLFISSLILSLAPSGMYLLQNILLWSRIKSPGIHL